MQKVGRQIVRTLLLTVACVLSAIGAKAQGADVEILDSRIRTVEFRHSEAADRTTGKVPQVVMCHLAAPETLTLDFDMIGSETETLYYTFLHANREWEPSDLMDMEFCNSINRFDGYDSHQQSFNTTTDYVHYHIDISTEPLTASGNYFVDVYSVSDDRLLLRQKLWICEDLCGVESEIEYVGSRQRLRVVVTATGMNISTPEEQLQVDVWQNKRLDDTRRLTTPTFINGGQASRSATTYTYTDIEPLYFEGGAEWLWADNRSIRNVTFGSARIEYFEPFYHYTLSADQRRPYTYREDFNGGSWIETQDRTDDVTVSADYSIVHFSFLPDDPELLRTHQFFVIGDATGWTPTSANMLSPNYDNISFDGQYLIKQGLHNYTYVARKREKDVPRFSDSVGSYGQTENDYFIAVYVHLPQDTYDRLTAFKTHNSMYKKR